MASLNGREAMAFGKQRGAAVRVAAIAAANGGGPKRAAGGSDVSRIPSRAEIARRSLKESPEQRQARLRAKTVNFTCTLVARSFILAGAAWYAWTLVIDTGALPRGVILGVFAMTVDYGRVLVKLMTPGTK